VLTTNIGYKTHHDIHDAKNARLTTHLFEINKTLSDNFDGLFEVLLLDDQRRSEADAGNRPSEQSDVTRRNWDEHIDVRWLRQHAPALQK